MPQKLKLFVIYSSVESTKVNIIIANTLLYFIKNCQLKKFPQKLIIFAKLSNSVTFSMVVCVNIQSWLLRSRFGNWLFTFCMNMSELKRLYKWNCATPILKKLWNNPPYERQLGNCDNMNYIVSVELCQYKTYHAELRMNIVFIPYKV